MKKENVSLMYDRKNSVSTTGRGNVEIRIYLSRRQVKMITLKKEYTPKEYKQYAKSKEVAGFLALYNAILGRMEEKNEPMTIACFDSHIGVTTRKKVARKQLRLLTFL